ncbi:MAG: hypothetical protein JRG96_03545 [Deltaproteobacteria bacterium]|nr:hypothetical protein [Deltaproteobacteria bacterium]MBW2417395.1 hypothetical protein [Deltaproteobacteria bacterium]
MSIHRRWAAGALIASLVALLGLAQTSGAEEAEVPFVDGKMWGETAPVLKRTYLVGISNLLAAEYLYQKKKGFPSDKHSSIRRVYEGIDEMSLDECIERIDAWYEKHPDRSDETVMGVIWLDMVVPNLPAHMRD